MRLHELIREFEEYGAADGMNSSEDLIFAVQDMLSVMMADDIKEVSTQEFSDALAKQGYNVSTEELIAAVDASGFASSVNADTITPKNELPPDMVGDKEALPDTSNMASDAAMDAIEDDL